MKVALLSESPADEAALRILVGTVIGTVQFVAPGFRARGWPNVVQLLPAVIRHLHFNTDVDVLVAVADSDDSVVHGELHERPNYFHPHCRVCQIRAVFRQTTRKLPPAHGRAHVLRGSAWRFRRSRRGTCAVGIRRFPKPRGWTVRPVVARPIRGPS